MRAGKSHLINGLLADVFAICDRALRGTRGVVMGIAVIDEATGKLTYAGVGNTSFLIAGTGQHRLGSDPGVVGAGYRTLSLNRVPLQPGDHVIVWTDGVEPEFDLELCPSWRATSPQQLAETILDRWGRESDDAAVLVFRYNSQDDGRDLRSAVPGVVGALPARFRREVSAGRSRTGTRDGGRRHPAGGSGRDP